MVPDFDWTRVVVTFIKSFFGYLSEKAKVAAATATLVSFASWSS